MNGISAGELSGAITNASKLTGVSAGDLASLIADLPRVEALCARTATLSTQSNSLLSAVGGISLEGAGAVPGLSLKIPSLPAALSSFACP